MEGEISKSMGIDTRPAFKFEINGFWLMLDPNADDVTLEQVESLADKTKKVEQMVEKSIETGLTAEYLILNTNPIKLPNDEEVQEYLKSFPYTKHLDDGQYNDGVIVGADLAIQWMFDKIQEGNNE